MPTYRPTFGRHASFTEAQSWAREMEQLQPSSYDSLESGLSGRAAGESQPIPGTDGNSGARLLKLETRRLIFQAVTATRPSRGEEPGDYWCTCLQPCRDTRSHP